MNLHYSNEISDVLYKNIVVRDTISKYWYARECVMHMNYLEAIDLYKELINYFDKNNNLRRKIHTQLEEFSIYSEIDHKKAKDYIENLENTLKVNLDKVTKQNILYAIAIFYYFQSKYEDALDYFIKSYDCGKRISCLLFIYACESRLNKLSIKEKVNSSSDVYIYIKYFEQKALNTDDRILENYIIDILLPYLEKERYKEPLWSIFEYELNQLVKKTRNYKSLQIFNEKMQHSLKTSA